MSQRVLITGLGILTSLGKGKEEFWQALREGRPGDRPITLFDPAEFRVKVAGEITDFDATIYMGKKGLRLLDRATRLMISSAKLCVDDTGFEITDENTDEIGVAIGTTFGSLKSIAEFDEVTLKEGPRYVNPALFPNTVINSPASQISIWNNIQGFNTTIAGGFTSSIDAMSYAYDFIQWDRNKVIYTGSVEELCYHSFFGFHALEFLSGSKEGQEFVNCPFDRRRNGVLFSEGAALMAFEDYDQALARGARVLGEVLGFGFAFDPFRIHKFNPRGTGMIEAMRDGLQNAGLDPKDIDCIFANANSNPAADRAETLAIKEVFGEYARKIPVTAVKSMVGESYSAGGAFAAAAALGAINRNFIPPTINYKEPDPDCDLDYVPNHSREAKLNRVLVNAFGPNGSNSCMILGRYEG